MHAGHLIRCVCCGEEAPEDTAKFDNQLNGPVCPECDRLLKWAQARIKESMNKDYPECKVRPMTDEDISSGLVNHKRFLPNQ